MQARQSSLAATNKGNYINGIEEYIIKRGPTKLNMAIYNVAVYLESNTNTIQSPDSPWLYGFKVLSASQEPSPVLCIVSLITALRPGISITTHRQSSRTHAGPWPGAR